MTRLCDDPLLSGVPVVDGYKVLDPAVLYARVGVGGMGSVYRGRHLNLDIDVAVKVLDADLARGDGEFVARFRREANLAAKINHPNLVRVFDVKQAHGLHYLVMEYVEGETALERVARKRKLGAVEALDITLEAARGLGAAHARGIVHRDVKPENLLIDREGNVKIADLGLAHAAEGGGLTQTKVRMGTPRYMPPEQWEDARSVGPPGDVWALGAMAYFLLAGEHAIREGSLPEILKRVCFEPFPDIRRKRPEVPDQIVQILERCTAKKPEERYANAGELAEALQAFRQRLDAPRLLPDAEAGLETTRLAVVSPPPSHTMAKIKEGSAPEAPSVRSPRKSALAPILLVLAVIAAGGGYLFLYVRGGDPGTLDEDDARSLREAVRASRERLAGMPRDFADQMDRADAAERALLKPLDRMALDIVRGTALAEVDEAIRIGDAMFADRDYEGARARLGKAKRELDALWKNMRPEVIRKLEELLAIQKGRSPEQRFAWTYLRLGAFYKDAGDLKKARETWRAGFALFPNDQRLKEAADA